MCAKILFYVSISNSQDLECNLLSLQELGFDYGSKFKTQVVWSKNDGDMNKYFVGSEKKVYFSITLRQWFGMFHLWK